MYFPFALVWGEWCDHLSAQASARLGVSGARGTVLWTFKCTCKVKGIDTCNKRFLVHTLITYYIYMRSQMVEVQAFVFWFFEGLTTGRREYCPASLKLSSRKSLITRPTTCSFDTSTGTRSIILYSLYMYIKQKFSEKNYIDIIFHPLPTHQICTKTIGFFNIHISLYFSWGLYFP